jgi:hypothetical protein
MNNPLRGCAIIALVLVVVSLSCLFVARHTASGQTPTPTPTPMVCCCERGGQAWLVVSDEPTDQTTYAMLTMPDPDGPMDGDRR